MMTKRKRSWLAILCVGAEPHGLHKPSDAQMADWIRRGVGGGLLSAAEKKRILDDIPEAAR